MEKQGQNHTVEKIRVKSPFEFEIGARTPKFLSKFAKTTYNLK